MFSEDFSFSMTEQRGGANDISLDITVSEMDPFINTADYHKAMKGGSIRFNDSSLAIQGGADDSSSDIFSDSDDSLEDTYSSDSSSTDRIMDEVEFTYSEVSDYYNSYDQYKREQKKLEKKAPHNSRQPSRQKLEETSDSLSSFTDTRGSVDQPSSKSSSSSDSIFKTDTKSSDSNATDSKSNTMTSESSEKTNSMPKQSRARYVFSDTSVNNMTSSINTSDIKVLNLKSALSRGKKKGSKKTSKKKGSKKGSRY
jgi:hypothetical protein